MSVTPNIRLVAWEDRGNSCVFVAVPNERGRYLRTDHSVVIVGCPACNTARGEPCISRQGYGGGTHAVRRTAAQAVLAQHGVRGMRVDDQIEPVEPGEPSLPPDFEKVGYAPIPNIVIRRKLAPGGICLIDPRPIA